MKRCLFSGLLWLVMSTSAIAGEQTLVEEFEQLTSACEARNLPGWSAEIGQFTDHVFDRAHEVSATDFGGMDTDGKEAPGKGSVFWLHFLFGAPYMPDDLAIKGLASACWVYFKDFRDALPGGTRHVADKSMQAWQACLWDAYRKPNPLAEIFEACYVAIPE